MSVAPAFGGFGTPAAAATTASTGFSFAQPATAQPTGLGSFGQSALTFGVTPAAPTTSGQCEQILFVIIIIELI